MNAISNAPDLGAVIDAGADPNPDADAQALEQAFRDFGADPSDYAEPEPEPEPNAEPEPDADAEPEPDAGANYTHSAPPRRPADFDASFERELEARLRRIEDARIAALNFTDPFTGELIQSAAQYEAYRRRADDEELDAKLQAGDPEAIRRIAERAAERKLAAEAEQARRHAEYAQRQNAFAQKLESDLTEIRSKYEPDVKSLADLQSKPVYAELYKRVASGAADGLADAYAQYQTERAAAEAAKQAEIDAAVEAALAKTVGKSHLRGTPASAASKGGMSRELMDALRDFPQNRRLSDAELRKKFG